MYVDVVTGEIKFKALEFRRLTEQVRDVDNIIKNKFRKPTHEKLYRMVATTTPDPATQALRNELQASRSPFQTRQWRPLTPDDIPEPTITRCRPVGSRPMTAQGFYGASLAAAHACHNHNTWTPGASSPAPPQRPRSTPTHGFRTPHGFSPRPLPPARLETPRVDPGDFDSLTPTIQSQLLHDVRPRPASASYGDRILTRRERPRRDRFKPRDSSLSKPSSPHIGDVTKTVLDDVSTTSGIDSGDGELDDVSDVQEDDDDDEEDEDDDNNDPNDESSDSEDGGFEPSLEEARRQVPHPEDVFKLRPEKLDALYVPENKRDMRRFDFDAEKVDLPPYDFTCPLPEQLSKVNLRLCAREGSDWKDFLPSAPAGEMPLQGLMDRLVEMERYQLITEEWESRKLRSQLRRQEKAFLNSLQNGNSNANNSSSRASSAKHRDKRCCGMCLQAACVGDCPEKRPNLPAGRCDKCFQPLCTGACQDSRYEQRMRHARSTDNLTLDEKPPPLPPRSPSRGCHSCMRKHNAKLLNANSILMGRPKSSLATYSRGKASSRPPKDLRPSSAANLNTGLLKDFERLGIEPQQPVPPKLPIPSYRPRSRNGLLPGKSSRSNRKTSITDSGSKKKRSRSSRGSKTAHNGS